MNARGRAVATGSAGLLIELSEVKVEVVEHDVADVRKVDALAEGRRSDDDAQASLAKEPLRLEAFGVRHLSVVEDDLITERLAQPLRHLGDLRPRVAVDDPLLVGLGGPEEVDEIADLIFGVARVD